MPYTFPEALATLPEAIAFFNKCATEAALLPKPPTAKGYSDLLAKVLPDFGTLIDRIRADIADTP